ncbi:MAG: hypothetical protein OXT69_01790 [Candidatus Poribacteria bacterium]|nr:hypothetical protein [Candidatus Poribacteria bacterium]
MRRANDFEKDYRKLHPNDRKDVDNSIEKLKACLKTYNIHEIKAIKGFSLREVNKEENRWRMRANRHISNVWEIERRLENRNNDLAHDKQTRMTKRAFGLYAV